MKKTSFNVSPSLWDCQRKCKQFSESIMGNIVNLNGFFLYLSFIWNLKFKNDFQRKED